MDLSVKMGGLKELNDALTALADKDGGKWKRLVMMNAGKKAMQPVQRDSMSRIPVDTGTARNAINTSHRYNRSANKALTKTGRLRARYDHEYSAILGIKKGGRLRYPYVLHRGISREMVHFRKTAWGKTTRKEFAVSTPTRRPVPYLHNPMNERASQTVKTFVRLLKRGIDIAVSKQYRSNRSKMKALKEI